MIPNKTNFKANLTAKGFNDSEIVAIASIPSYGILRDPMKSDMSIYPKLDSYYYKQILAGASGDKLALKEVIVGDASLKEIAEKFA